MFVFGTGNLHSFLLYKEHLPFCPKFDHNMTSRSQKLYIIFYATDSRREPVREWLKDLDQADRRVIGVDILAVQKRWPLGLPLCRPLGEGLWEVRPTLPSRRIAKVIFPLTPEQSFC